LIRCRLRRGAAFFAPALTVAQRSVRESR